MVLSGMVTYDTVVRGDQNPAIALRAWADEPYARWLQWCDLTHLTTSSRAPEWYSSARSPRSPVPALCISVCAFSQYLLVQIEVRECYAWAHLVGRLLLDPLVVMPLLPVTGGAFALGSSRSHHLTTSSRAPEWYSSARMMTPVEPPGRRNMKADFSA